MSGDQLHPRVQYALDQIAAATFGTGDLQLEIPRVAVDPFGIVTALLLDAALARGLEPMETEQTLDSIILKYRWSNA